MLGERIASQSDVIRAILSGYSPCCGAPHLHVRSRIETRRAAETGGIRTKRFAAAA